MHSKFHEGKSQLTFFLSKPVAPCCASSQAPRLESSVSLSDFMELLVQLSGFYAILEAPQQVACHFGFLHQWSRTQHVPGIFQVFPNYALKKMNTLKFYKSLQIAYAFHIHCFQTPNLSFFLECFALMSKDSPLTFRQVLLPQLYLYPSFLHSHFHNSAL